MRPTRSELLAEVERLRLLVADMEETIHLADMVLIAAGQPIPRWVNAARRSVRSSE